MTTSTPRAVLAYVQDMPAIDLFDYLADYTPNEPRDDASREPAAMRAAVLAHVRTTGPAAFLTRMAQQNGADGTDTKAESHTEDAEAMAYELADKMKRRAENRRAAKGF